MWHLFLNFLKALLVSPGKDDAGPPLAHKQGKGPADTGGSARDPDYFVS
jgi:hypothetical protein